MMSMQQEFDLVIRGGLVADGSGQEPRIADVAIRGEKIAAVGSVSASGQREIDAHVSGIARLSCRKLPAVRLATHQAAEPQTHMSSVIFLN